MAAHLAGDVAEHHVLVVELDAEHRVGQGLDDLALHLDLLFLCPCGAESYQQRASRSAPRPRSSAATRASSPGRPAGQPRQLQRIVLVARNHVHVEVEDRLPGGAARCCCRMLKPPAAIVSCMRSASRRAGGHRRQQVLVGTSNRFSACSRGDHDDVAARGRVDVHAR